MAISRVTFIRMRHRDMFLQAVGSKVFFATDFAMMLLAKMNALHVVFQIHLPFNHLRLPF